MLGRLLSFPPCQVHLLPACLPSTSRGTASRGSGGLHTIPSLPLPLPQSSRLAGRQLPGIGQQASGRGMSLPLGVSFKHIFTLVPLPPPFLLAMVGIQTQSFHATSQPTTTRHRAQSTINVFRRPPTAHCHHATQPPAPRPMPWQTEELETRLSRGSEERSLPPPPPPPAQKCHKREIRAGKVPRQSLGTAAAKASPSLSGVNHQGQESAMLSCWQSSRQPSEQSVQDQGPGCPLLQAPFLLPGGSLFLPRPCLNTGRYGRQVLPMPEFLKLALPAWQLPHMPFLLWEFLLPTTGVTSTREPRELLLPQ